MGDLLTLTPNEITKRGIDLRRRHEIVDVIRRRHEIVDVNTAEQTVTVASESEEFNSGGNVSAIRRVNLVRLSTDDC